MSLQLMVILLPHSLSHVLRLQAQAATFASQVVLKMVVVVGAKNVFEFFHEYGM